MAPDDRRAAIVAATVPLLREHGLNLSTRQIAQAAGVAEGTLFGVFPDKGALIRAALISLLDPEPAARQLAEIAPGLDLRARLVAALDLLRDGFDRNSAIVSALRSGAGEFKHDAEGMREFFRHIQHSRTRLVQALAELMEPDKALLRRSPIAVARSLFMLLLMTGRTAFGEEEDRLDSAEIVSLLLDGLLVRPEGPPC
jgi:AcrR family transcriptional regulator